MMMMMMMMMMMFSGTEGQGVNERRRKRSGQETAGEAVGCLNQKIGLGGEEYQYTNSKIPPKNIRST